MLHLEFNSDSENEGIARIVTAAYIMKFDPDMEEMDDIKTVLYMRITIQMERSAWIFPIRMESCE